MNNDIASMVNWAGIFAGQEGGSRPHQLDVLKGAYVDAFPAETSLKRAASFWPQIRGFKTFT